MVIKHPDYDIDFKPAIARFDWDQTYDVLEFVYLPQGFSQLLNLCGIPAFELMAIDRFTPYRYRWADQYSYVVYEFLKAFNFSPHNSINERLLKDESGALIKDENDNNITVPKFSLANTQTYNYEPILANFGEGKYQITALIYQGYQKGLTGSINTINQAFAEFTLVESTEIDLNNIILHRWLKDDYYPNGNSNQFCSNSFVISRLSNGNWVNYTPSFTSKPTWLLFDDITSYFNNVKQQLINYFQKIHNDYGIIQQLTGKDTLPLQGYLKSIKILPPFDIVGFLGEIDYIFDILPTYITESGCYLACANNNKWSMQTNYYDLDIDNFIFNNKLSAIQCLVNTRNINTPYLHRTPQTIYSLMEVGSPHFTNAFINTDKSKKTIGTFDYINLKNKINFGKELFALDFPFFLDFYNAIFPLIGSNKTQTEYLYNINHLAPAWNNLYGLGYTNYTLANAGGNFVRDDCKEKWVIWGDFSNNSREWDLYLKKVQKNGICFLKNGSKFNFSIDYGLYTESTFSLNSTDVKLEKIIFSLDDWNSINLYRKDQDLSHQEYLDLLLQLKEQYEEMSKTW